VLEVRKLYWLLISVLAFVSIGFAADITPGASRFESGIYEGLMLAVDAQGNVTGFYREEQGEGVTKTCSFFLSGKATSDETSVITWNDETFPGTIKSEKGGVKLKIARGREHPGCGLVLLPQISDGITLDQVIKAKWIGLRKIVRQRVYLHSEPVSSKKLRAFVVKGDVVGVVSESGGWLLVEYPGRTMTTKGWMQASDTMKWDPPAR
jgi:hypothetical protein